MSNVFLIVALLSTFFAVLLVMMAVDVVVTERRRSVRLLEAQVASGQGSGAGIPNFREEELSKPLALRLGKPFLSAAAGIARRVTPLTARERIGHKLILAGNPRGWDAERVISFKVVGGVTGVVVGIAATGLIHLGGLVLVVLVALLGFAGFVLPDSVLDGRVEKRQTEIRKALPDFLDLLTISVEAGLSLNAAITRAVQRIPGAISQEFARFLQEVQLGVSRSEALRNVNARTEVEELNSFVIAMIQAETFGIAIANVLRTQAVQMRVKRRQRIEMKAQQTPVKIVFPLILCILPSLFVVIVGPGAIRIFQQVFGPGGLGR